MTAPAPTLTCSRCYRQCREVFLLLAAQRTLDARLGRRRAERLVYLMQQTGEGACT